MQQPAAGINLLITSCHRWGVTPRGAVHMSTIQEQHYDCYCGMYLRVHNKGR